MSVLAIRRGLESLISELSPSFPTGWENRAFTPVAGTAHQLVFFIPAETQSPTVGASRELTQESGIMQVTLRYPENTGTKDILTRADLIRAAFPKGKSVTSGGVTVKVLKRPSVAVGQGPKDGWYSVAISIPYFANIHQAN